MTAPRRAARCEEDSGAVALFAAPFRCCCCCFEDNATDGSIRRLFFTLLDAAGFWVRRNSGGTKRCTPVTGAAAALELPPRAGD